MESKIQLREGIENGIQKTTRINSGNTTNTSAHFFNLYNRKSHRSNTMSYDEYLTFDHKGGITRETLIGYLLSITNELSKKPEKQRKANLEHDLRKLCYIVKFYI